MVQNQNETENNEFIHDTVVDVFLHLARVNLLTGEYEYLKWDNDVPPDALRGANIYEYMKQLAASDVIYPEYVDGYLRFADPEYVRGRAFSGERRIIYRYRRRSSDGKGIWMIHSIICPANCSPENPWVAFALRAADSESTAITVAMAALSVVYHKILNIDLEHDTYDIVKLDEYDDTMAHSPRVSQWLRAFAEAGNVHPEDLDTYYDFTDTDHILSHFSQSQTRLSCRYRRKTAQGGYRWAQMDILPQSGIDFNKTRLVLFVKDVHEEHLAEMHHRQELIDNFNRDALTMLFNRHTFQEDEERLKGGAPCRVSCLYVDVNGLHEVNNHLGHQAGDNMLCTVADTLKKFFPDERVYRIGGDEFVVLSTRLSKGHMDTLVERARSTLLESSYEISVGAAEGDSTRVYNIVGMAELAMRKNKEDYYKRSGDTRRKRCLDDELEQIMTKKQDEEFFLNVISEKYAGVYYVDMKRDTVRYIYIPDFFMDVLQRMNFSYIQAITLYIEKYVRTEYYDQFIKLTDPEYLMGLLEDREFVNIDYVKVDGTPMNLQIFSMNHKGEDRVETVWIFSNGDM